LKEFFIWENNKKQYVIIESIQYIIIESIQYVIIECNTLINLWAANPAKAIADITSSLVGSCNEGLVSHGILEGGRSSPLATIVSYVGYIINILIKLYNIE
jgi:hypothetical protein